MSTSSFSVPLPSSWPKHAKAATLHVISLANFALTQVRGWAANSPIHRVRLAAQLDQLKSEVAMLREEIRIKDARMAALAPQRRPHYPPSERMAILQLMAARGWSKAQTGRRFLVIDDTVASAAGQKLLRGCHAAWRRTSSSRNSAPYTQLNRWGWASQRDMNAIIAECSSSVELNTPRRKTLAESC